MTNARARTIESFATCILLEQHAIAECEHHGYIRDRADPHALERAREAASRERFKGATKDDRIKAIDDVMRSIGDTCPECTCLMNFISKSKAAALRLANLK